MWKVNTWPHHGRRTYDGQRAMTIVYSGPGELKWIMTKAYSGPGEIKLDYDYSLLRSRWAKMDYRMTIAYSGSGEIKLDYDYSLLRLRWAKNGLWL